MSSGQPYKKFTDIEKYRNEYIEDLNRRAQLDDLVHQAVKNYNATGSLPAVSQMKDTRTTSEILADTEKLKRDLAGTLAKVSDLQFGNAVVQRILNSPLNQDNTLLIFASQRINDIVDKLKKIYTYGIKGDPNDIQQIVNFIAKMYEDKNNLAKSTKEFLMSNNVNIGNIAHEGGYRPLTQFSNIVSIGQKITSKLSEIRNFFRDYEGENAIMANIVRLIESIKNLIDTTNDLIPINQNFMSELDVYIINGETTQAIPREHLNTAIQYKDYIINGLPSATHMDIVYKKLLQYYNILVKTLPIYIDTRERLLHEIDYNDIDNEIRNKIQPLDKALQTNINDLNQSLINLEEIYTPSIDWNINNIMLLRDRIQEMDLVNEIQGEHDQPLHYQELPQEPQHQYPQYPQEQPEVFYNQRNQQIAELVQQLDNFSLNNVLQAMIQHHYIEDQDMINAINNDELEDEEKYNLIQNTLTYSQRYNVGGLGGINGLGIHKPKRGRGRPKGSGIKKTYAQTVAKSLSNEGIEPERRFVKFGRYLINTKKLNDGILAVKRPSGNGIVEFPSQRISNNFRKVVKTMIGGGNPSFSDLEALSEPERVHLHKLASKADIVDKFNIPTPSKTKYEQDIHDFEVMKGEIMSGNDSKELVKKFKLHILKLSKLGALPKAEVQDILETLVELGY